MEAVIFDADRLLTQNEFEKLLPFISLKKQAQIERFHSFQDAQNSLLGDILARVEICRVTGLCNKELKFSTNTYGKPFLKNVPYIHFNISHTGNCIAFVMDDQPVGIDIELIRPINLRIAERFFASDEASYIMNGSQVERFFEIWTKKESRIKWEGKGLSKPFSSFSVFEPAELDTIFYHKIFQNSKSICHVCSQKQNEPLIKMVGIDSLMQMHLVKDYV